jgi:hypothetical protein
LDDGVSIFDAENFFLPFSPIISFYVAVRSLSNLLWWSGYPVIILIISPSRHLKRRISKKKLRALKRDRNNYPNADQMYSNACAHKTHENSRNVSPWAVLSLVHLAL